MRLLVLTILINLSTAGLAITLPPISTGLVLRTLSKDPASSELAQYIRDSLMVLSDEHRQTASKLRTDGTPVHSSWDTTIGLLRRHAKSDTIPTDEEQFEELMKTVWNAWDIAD